MGIVKRLPVDETRFLDEAAQAFIATVSENLSVQEDIDHALCETMDQVAEFVGAEALSIFVVDQKAEKVVLKWATGEVSQKIIGLRLQIGQGIVGWVVKYSEDLIIPYPGMDTRFFDAVDESTGFATDSILCSPILADGQVIGAIEVLNKTEGTFNDDDLILVRAIARQVAQVISRVEA